MALAVSEDVVYVKVRDISGASLYLAKDLAATVLGPGYEILEELQGSALLGTEYEPLFTFSPNHSSICGGCGFRQHR